MEVTLHGDDVPLDEATPDPGYIIFEADGRAARPFDPFQLLFLLYARRPFGLVSGVSHGLLYSGECNPTPELCHLL